MIGKISGTGSYVPSRYLDNHNLSQIVDTSDEWIQERTGIIRRHDGFDGGTSRGKSVGIGKDAAGRNRFVDCVYDFFECDSALHGV